MDSIVLYYPDDWVAVIEDGRARLCPRTLYQDPKLFAEWRRTGIIPSGTPELRRVCSIRNVEVGEASDG